MWVRQVTERSLYTCIPGRYKETNHLPLDALIGVQMSSFADGFMVLFHQRLTPRYPHTAHALPAHCPHSPLDVYCMLRQCGCCACTL